MASTSLMTSSSTHSLPTLNLPSSLVIASSPGGREQRRWSFWILCPHVPIAPSATLRGPWSISAASHLATSLPPAQEPIPGSNTDRDRSNHLLNHRDGATAGDIRNGVGGWAAGRSEEH